MSKNFKPDEWTKDGIEPLVKAPEQQMNDCVVCGQFAEVVYNINFKAVPICLNCALLITKQTVVEFDKKSLSVAIGVDERGLPTDE